MITKMINFKTLLILIFLIFSNKSFSINSNFVIATVDRDPITYLDLIEKSKLKYYLYNKNNKFQNLKKYYDSSLKDLISERLLINKALKSNKDIMKLTELDARKYLNQRFNTKEKLENFFTDSGLSKNSYIYNVQLELIKKFLINKMFKKEFDDYLEGASVVETKNKNVNQLDLEQLTLKINRSDKDFVNKLDKKLVRYLEYGYSFKDIARLFDKKTDTKVIAGRSGWQNEIDFKKNVFEKFFSMKEGEFVKEKTANKITYIRVIAKRINGVLSSREQLVELIQLNFETKNFSTLKLVSILDDFELNNSKLECSEIEKQLKMNTDVKTYYIKAKLTDFSERILNQIYITKEKNFTNPINFNNNTLVFYVCDKIIQNKIPKKVKLDEKRLNKKVVLLTEKIVKILKKDAVINIKMKIDDIK